MYLKRRTSNRESVENVFHPRNFFEYARGLIRFGGKYRRIASEDLDVDRLGSATGQIADVVLEQLSEVGVDCRLNGSDTRSQVVHNRLDAGSLPSGFELDDVVTAVRLGNEESELLSGAARVASDGWIGNDDALRLSKHRVCLGQ